MGWKHWLGMGTLLAAVFGWILRGPAAGQEVLRFYETTTPETVQTTQGENALEFPYVLGDAGLIVQHMAQYEGPFLEDGSQEPVAEVAALMISNPRKQGVCSAELVLWQGQEQLVFAVTYLPPGGKVLVLEKNGKHYSKGPVTQCACTELQLGDFYEEKGQITVLEQQEVLIVENRMQKLAEKVTVYYKEYIFDGNYYLGGRTRTVVVEKLLPGERRQILPYGYAPGYSRVICALEEE